MPIHSLKLIDRYVAARGTFVYVFEKPAGFQFKPGQYGGFTLVNPIETDKGGLTRRFSLLNTPNDNYIAIATRMQNSAYKRSLHALEIGQTIKFAGPTGNFILHEDQSTPAVMIAGGIGITPFYCMIKDALHHQSSQSLFLFYGNQTPDDSAFLDELIHLSHEHTNFKFIASMATPTSNWQGEVGFINDKMIKTYVPNLKDPIYYICGSPAMVTALQELLVEMGVADDRIKVEDFPGY